MKKKFRKPRPSPPKWFWSDNDNCWDCNCNYTGCSGCKRLKKFRREYRDKKYEELYICYRTGTELLVKKFKSCGCLNSKGQLKIKQLLTKNNINFIAQYQNEKLKSPKNMPLKIDFMIIDDENNPIRAIECDGIQHYEPIEHFGGEQAFLYLRKCDTIKNEWCKQNNIPMIRIPNLNIEDIEKITLEEIFNNKYAI